MPFSLSFLGRRSPSLGRLGAVLGLVLTAIGAGGCGSSAGSASVAAIRVTVDPVLLPPVMDSLHLVISAPSKADLTQDLPAQAAQLWEVSIAKINGPLVAGVAITGLKRVDGGPSQPVITSAAYFTVNPGKRTEVLLHLSAACVGAAAPVCGATETCQDGVCVPIPGLTPDAGGPGGASGGGTDASTDTAADAPPIDLAPDLPGTDALPDADPDDAPQDQTTTDVGDPTDGSADTGPAVGTRAPGDPCQATSECAAGVCSTADHVCCDTACSGICESCLASKTQKAAGVCSPLPKGSNADSDCTPGTTTCGATGSCDGSRKCGLGAKGVACEGASACSGGQLTVTPATCDGAGACVLGTPATTPCPGMVSCKDAVACMATTCTTDANCAAGNYCDQVSKMCAPKVATGKACAMNGQCTSGFCADGVCCNGACAGKCEACLKTKTGVDDGRCAAVATDTDPDNECAPDAPPCGHTGLCDHNGGSGQGACAWAAKGVTCPGGVTCSGSTLGTTTGSCSGAGACTQSSATPSACAGGFACASATACGTTCTAGTSSGCAAGFVCAGGTACVAPAFVAGPCIVTTDFTTLDVFARGKDQHIYRKVRSATAWASAWTNLADLDGALLDNRADLDCAANDAGTHIVSSGINPAGAFLRALGSGTTYNNFKRDYTTLTFDLNVSVAGRPAVSEYYTASIKSFPYFYWIQDSGTTDLMAGPVLTSSSFTSAVDLALIYAPSQTQRFIAGFDTRGVLAIYPNTYGSAGVAWASSAAISPPSGMTFSYSPTVCTNNTNSGTSYDFHAVAVAGGKVWHTSTPSFFSTVFTGWEQIAASTASAPDCAVLSDGSTHVVITNASGHVIQIEGKSGGPWTSVDLGTY